MPDGPVINLQVFEREVYMLSVMLLADEKLLEYNEFIGVAAVNYDGEVNRLLIMLATAARQIIKRYPNDAEVGKIEKRGCGERWKDFKDKEADKKPDKLSFLQACHSIIHATELTANDSFPSPRLGSYNGRVYIIEEKRKGTKGTKAAADMDGMEFARCCILLSRRVGGIQFKQFQDERKLKW